MTRKIQPIQSTFFNDAGTAVVPTGCRIHSVRGENDSKPTYDFTVVLQVWSTTASASQVLNTKYCGTPNGATVNLWREWPEMTTKNNAPTVAGDVYLTVIGGTGTSGQVYYLQGSTSDA